MGISNLFEKQRPLDAEITEKHPVLPGEDRLKKKMLAFDTEVGELSNEVRSWKFWSTDQEPRTNVWEDYTNPLRDEGGRYRNLVLEEYVDCLHFLLSIGNDLEFDGYHLVGNYFQTKPDVVDAFLVVNEQLALLSKTYRMQGIRGDVALTVYFALLLESFLELGNVLGFTEEQIVEAYEQKNQINWERQSSGY